MTLERCQFLPLYVQLALDVAGLHQSDIAVVVGVVRVIRKLAVGDEPFEQLLDDGLGGIVVGELVQVVWGRECLHGDVLHRLVDGIDAAGKGRGRKRPSYKVLRTPQFTGRCVGKRKPADRVEGRVRGEGPGLLPSSTI
jgi:hypothetical protein